VEDADVKWRSGQARNSPSPVASGFGRPATAIGPELTWPAFWDIVQVKLRDRGYRRSSLVVVRQVLRSLAKTCGVPPGNVTREHLDKHFRRLTARRASASWLAMNISILRTVFDKICARSLLEGRLGPRRPERLPRILSRQEVESIHKAARDFREALLLGLLAECGLKIGEVCTLKWSDIHPDTDEIHVVGSGSTLERTVPIPPTLGTLLREGKRRFSADVYLFPGRRPHAALSTRMAERIVRRCARRVGLPRHVTSMVIRHAYAVLALEDGVNIRELQTRLGHARVETTMLYQRCLAPEETVSPLDVSESPSVPRLCAAETAKTKPSRSHDNRVGRLQGLSEWLRKRLGVSSG